MMAQSETTDQTEDDGLALWMFVITALIVLWVWNKDRKRLRKQDEEQQRMEQVRQATIAKMKAQQGTNKYLNDADVAEIMRDAERQRQQQLDRGHHNCPHCGAELEEFSSHCPYCGHELREMLAEKTVSQFFDEFNATYSREAKSALINEFRLPTDREGVMEFLALSAPLAKRLNPLTSTRWGRVLLTFLAVFIVLFVGNLFIFSINGIDVGRAIDDSLFMLPFLGSVPAYFVSRRTDTVVSTEHNRFAPLWRRRFNECLKTARQKFSSDGTTFDRLEKEARESAVTLLLTGGGTL